MTNRSGATGTFVSGLLVWVAIASLVSANEPPLRPIQRIELPPERVAAEMNRVEQGVLTRLHRSEFEQLVHRAGQAAAALEETPRLIEARYKATMQGDGIAGTAEWRLLWNREFPGRFPLDSLSLAIRSARWADETRVLLGHADHDPARPVALLVPGPGERRLVWEWSARGVAEPHGMRVDFRVPSSLMASLDLELPTDYTVQVEREGAIVAGPTPAADPSWRTWRVTLPRGSGAVGSRIVFRRPPLPDQPPPLMRVKTTSIQRLAPGQFEAEYQFDIKVSRGEIHRLAIDLDAALRPVELLCPEADSWNIVPQAEGRSRIDVTLRSALRQGRIVLRTVSAPPAANQVWISPSATMPGALAESERLLLYVHPELRLDEWSAGRFTPVPPPTDTPGWTAVALEATSLGVVTNHRPRGFVRNVPRSLRSRETWECRIHRDRAVLGGEILIATTRGEGVGQVWDIPSGWEVDEVTARAGEPEVSWQVVPGPKPGSSLLRVVPLRANPTTGNERYSIRLRSTELNWVAGPQGEVADFGLPLPQLHDSQGRDGTLIVKLEPTLTHEPFGSTLEPDTPVNFRGSIDARIRLRRRSERYRVQIASRWTLGEKQIRATHVWTIQAPQAAVREIWLLTPGNLRFLSWRVIAGSVRLQGVEPISSIGLFGFQVWRVSLDRPIKGPVTLEWIIEPISLPEESTVLAPLPLPVGAEVSEVIGTVRMDPGSSWRIDTEGTIELPPQANEEVWLERVVRLGPPQRLRFVRQEPTNRSARVAQASLTTTLERFGAVVYHARFIVGGWSGRDLPIQLPPGAEIASIRLGQRPWHTHGHISTDRNFLVLPWNPARDWETVEIEYRLPGRSPIGFAWLQADPPRLPIDADWTYFWRWPDRFAPLTPGATFGTEETVTNRFEQITDWTASDSRCTTVWLVDTTAVRLVMLAEFSALIILMLVLPRGHRFLFGVGLFSLGILMIWLPAELLGGMWIPLGAGIALAMVFVVATLNRRQRRRAAANRSSFARVSATAAVGALWVGWLAGSTPQPVAVFLLPAAPGEEQAVLAPPQLLSELKSLVERAMVMTPLVLDARLEGQASAREVRWTGRFTVHAASETGGVLPLRLGDTQLISAELNGVPVFPELSVDRGTYEFRLPAQGTHRLTVVFTSLVTDGADSETRFSIAEIPICTAVVDFPQGTTEMQFLSSRGIQKIDVGGKAARLEADLGRVSTIQLRWRSATHPSDRPGTVEAAHLWDVSEQQARLLSVFRFRLGSGVMRRVEFDVPSSLELVDVVIRPVDDPLNLFGLTGPRDWRQSASPEATRHRLEFAVPLSGQVQVELELVPRQSLPENWIVTAPEVVGDYDRQTVVGVRLTGRSIQVRASMGWESASPAEFLRRHWRPLRVDALDREPEVAFRRSGPFDPTIAMALTTTPKGAVQQRVEWRTGPGRSSLQAVSQWTGIVGPGPLEWEVPAGITIHEVRGDGVAGWSRAGSVLQIWLSPQRPDAVNVTLDGFLPTPSVGTQPFELPPLRPMNVRSVHAELVVAPRDDWRMSVLDAGAYRQHPTTELPGVRWSGFAEHPSTTVWALHPAGGTIAGDVVTVVEPLDREFAFRAVARAELGLLPGSDVATVWLEARHGGSELPRLQIPAGCEIRDTRPIAGGTRWIIDAPPGPMHVSVVGRSPRDETPFISLRQPAEPTLTARHWLATAPGFRLGNALPATSVDLPPAELLSAARIDPEWTVWRISTHDQDLTLQTQTGLRHTWLELSLAPGPRHWLARLAGWVAVEPTASIRPPNGRQFLSVQVNGRELTSLEDLAQGAPLPRGLSFVTMVWPAHELDFQLPELVVTGASNPLTPVFVTVVWPNPGLLRSSRAALDPVEVEPKRQESFQDFLRRLGPSFSKAESSSPRVPSLPNLADGSGGPYDSMFLRGDRFTWIWEPDGPPEISLPEAPRPPAVAQVIATAFLTLAILGLFVIRRS